MRSPRTSVCAQYIRIRNMVRVRVLGIINDSCVRARASEKDREKGRSSGWAGVGRRWRRSYYVLYYYAAASVSVLLDTARIAAQESSQAGLLLLLHVIVRAAAASLYTIRVCARTR